MNTRRTKGRIIVTGYVGLVPVGGVAWDYMQYIVGLRRLGYDVYYYEAPLAWPYDPVKRSKVATGGYSARYINGYFRRFAPELCDRWHYWHLREQCYGMSQIKMAAVARSADIFLNVSGSSSIPADLSPDCTKVFIDTDPGYNQIVMTGKINRRKKVPGFLRAHDRYFTYAENINGKGCLIPKLDVKWKTTRMPVVVSLWPPSERLPRNAPWTTVMTWSRLKSTLTYNGTKYKGKDQEFRKIEALPNYFDTPFALALGGHKPPIHRIINNNWIVLDGPTATNTPLKYQKFIKKSKGEISIAKNVYVALRTGWFSCRSACYLASRRPVVLQDTGFSHLLPVGQGVLTFDSTEQAVEGITKVERDYKKHADAAYDVAQEYFESDKVLRQLIADIAR